MKLRNFILAASCVVAIVFFSLCFFLIRDEFEQNARQQAADASETLAKVTFATMYELMSTGWSRSQAESFLASVEKAGGREQHVQIFRGPLVASLYGEITQPPLDGTLSQVFASGQESRTESGTQQRHVFPLLAEARCLKCHTNASVGQALGAIEVRHDLGRLLDEANRKTALSLFGLSLLAMVGALAVVFWVNRRIERAVNQVEAAVTGINAVSDLRHLQFSRPDSGFVELNRILASIGDLSEKLHDIAVDKDILKFEISLLERFVITSEVVRDWHQYLAQLIEDINQVLAAHMLFSVFEIDEELFDLEIFWRYPPTPETRAMTERHVRDSVHSHPRFSDLSELQIHHHVCKVDGPTISLSEQEVTVRVKSFFVDNPKIGGIVGIGVHARDLDDTRFLVMDSILSTLMNVIGSVKAIYKYTRDLEYYSTRDPLTDLFNQRVFWEMLSFEEERARRHNQTFGLIIIDVDNFCTINDNFGHRVGDRLLQALVAVFKQHIQATDILARYGGDEFVVILPNSDAAATARVAETILAASQAMESLIVDGQPVRTTLSMGMGLFPEHAENSKDLFLFADNLLYKAKVEGKNRISIPTPEDAAQAFRDISERSMMVLNAIENRGVIPFFQPILDIDGNRILGYECLSRLPFGSDVLRADTFIELAERLGVIHRLDLVVIERALDYLKDHPFDGLIFFNLSPRALMLSEFSRRLRELVDAAGIAPQRIVFEITERDTVRNMDMLERFLIDLKLQGFQLALDDFGSGFSSFHYLRRFPIDFLKIEGDFVTRLASDAHDRAFVQCMRDLAADLNLKVIAEFVENQEVLDILHGMGVDCAQGYHVGKPAATIPL